MTLAGCATSVDKRHLPPAPGDFGKVVPIRPIAAGSGAKAALAAERADHIEANRRLDADSAFYADVRAKFGAAE